MPYNASEEYLLQVGTKSFLSLWAYPNPYWAAHATDDFNKRKELCDLLVVFGPNILVFSDKSNAYPSTDDPNINWKRWYRRTIDESAKQLVKAKARLLQEQSTVYERHTAHKAFPLDLPAPHDARIFLIAVARTAGAICEAHYGRRSLTIDTNATGDSEYLTVGTEIRGEFIHVFDAATFDTLLARLDTTPDLIAYLDSKETALRSQQYVIEGEENLLATYLCSLNSSGRYEVPGTRDKRKIHIPSHVWDEYIASDRYKRSQRDNKFCYCIDRLVEQMAQDIRTGTTLIDPSISISEHEQALRYLVSESRLGRRIIAEALREILEEEDTKTFWMSTVPSHARKDIRYVWVTYPPIPRSVPLELAEEAVLSELSRYIVSVARQFPARVTIGIAVPNRKNTMTTYIVRMAGEGTIGSFPPTEPIANLTKFHKLHFD